MVHGKLFGWVAALAAVLTLGGTWTIVAGQSASGQSAVLETPPPTGQPRVPATRRPGNFAPVAPGAEAALFGNRSFKQWAASSEVAYGQPSAAEDPEMSELEQIELKLTNESQDALARYAASENAKEQKEIRASLHDLLATQFDVQRKRREVELSRIEERVRRLREQLKKRNDARESIVERRLDQLTNEAEGLGWGQPGASAGQNVGHVTPYYYHGLRLDMMPRTEGGRQ